jgi:DNA-binding NarL/FixJ family response regulator
MAKRRLWTNAEVKTLRSLAGSKSVKAIGRALKRSESAVRFKAHMKRIPLAMK